MNFTGKCIVQLYMYTVQCIAIYEKIASTISNTALWILCDNCSIKVRSIGCSAIKYLT